VVEAVATLLFVFGSGGELLVTSTVSVNGPLFPSEVTVTESVTAAELVAAIEGTVHVTLFPLSLPWWAQAHPAGALALLKSIPDGNESVKTTLVASLGPPLLTVMS
jgi:hypothetical protein